MLTLSILLSTSLIALLASADPVLYPKLPRIDSTVPGCDDTGTCTTGDIKWGWVVPDEGNDISPHDMTQLLNTARGDQHDDSATITGSYSQFQTSDTSSGHGIDFYIQIDMSVSAHAVPSYENLRQQIGNMLGANYTQPFTGEVYDATLGVKVGDYGVAG